MPGPHSPAPAAARSRFRRRVEFVFLALLLAWLSLVFWNSGKPLPPGTHIASQISRLSEADVEFLYEPPLQPDGPVGPARAVAAIDRAEQLVVLDRSPVTSELALHVLARKRQRPNIQIVLVTDPAHESFGGTSAQTLASLEQAGIIVARVRLERLRDSNPLYSGLWRLVFGWWSSPFDEASGQADVRAWSRMLNAKADQRQLVLADDGAGGWTAILEGAGAPASLVLRGSLARAMIAGELQIAAWSTDDDRLPAGPQMEGRGVGSIDARFLTEGAIEAALLDAVGGAGGGDRICIAVDNLSDRPLIAAMLLAAARGVRLQVLLAQNRMPNQAVAGELLRDGNGRIEVRWYPRGQGASHPKVMLVLHRTEVWMNFGEGGFSRRSLGDLNLAAGVELRMPVRSSPARAVSEYFAAIWSGASAAEKFPEDAGAYWRYRLAEATGLSSF